MFNRSVYWIMFLGLVFVGILKILLIQLKKEKGQKIVTIGSMVLSITTVFFLALTRGTYAIALAFLLLLIKGTLIFKCI